MDKNFFQNNRRRLAEALEGESFAAVLSSGYEVTRSADENYDFQVNTNFFYLTGIRQSKVYLVIHCSREKGELSYREMLFIDAYDENYAKWIGHRLIKEEASELSGVALSDIFYKEEYESILNELTEKGCLFYLDLEKNGNVNFNSFGLSLAAQLAGKVEVKDLYPTLIGLRAAKDTCEAEAIAKAVATTKAGIEALMAKARPGLYEYQLEAWFDHTLKDLGNKKTSFKTIAASGMNATTLHYSTNDSLMKEGDLVLFDLGAKEGEYCADITRTFPVNGRFTDLQKTVYNIVLAANKRVEKEAKAGMTLGELQTICVETLTEGCLVAGLIASPEEIKRVYFHGVSHSLGLDTHDPMPRGIPLPVGAVITDEPGLYFPEHGIGIRIEDDLYIQENGAINLSKDIIKEPEEIEAFMEAHRDA